MQKAFLEENAQLKAEDLGQSYYVGRVKDGLGRYGKVGKGVSAKIIVRTLKNHEHWYQEMGVVGTDFSCHEKSNWQEEHCTYSIQVTYLYLYS